MIKQCTTKKERRSNMKNEILKTAVGAVMSPKVRAAVKITSGVLWLLEKGIDVYTSYGARIDQEMYIDKMVESSIKDISGIKKMAQEEAQKEVRKEIAKAMAASGTKNDEINAFLKSLNGVKKAS